MSIIYRQELLSSTPRLIIPVVSAADIVVGTPVNLIEDGSSSRAISGVIVPSGLEMKYLGFGKRAMFCGMEDGRVDEVVDIFDTGLSDIALPVREI